MRSTSLSLLLISLAACVSPVETETRGGAIANLEGVKDAIHEAASFDEAVQIAIDAGLEVIGSLEPSDDGRRVLIVDPAAPDVVLVALGVAAQVSTTGTPSFAVANAVTATCTVDGTDARVFTWSDGKIYGLQGTYAAELKVCDPGGGWQCEKVTQLLKSATDRLDAAGGAQRGADGAGARERLVVTSGSIGADRMADAMTVVDDRGRRTCEVRLNSDLMASYMSTWSERDQKYLRKVLMHELGHCIGLHHADVGTEDVMAPGLANWDAIPTDYTVGAKAVIRRIAAGGPVALSNCKFGCSASATYDAAKNACICKGGAAPRPGTRDCVAPAGGRPDEPPGECFCDGPDCVDTEGNACGTCGVCAAPVCDCEDGACVDVSSGAACGTCPFDCDDGPRSCGCEDGSCVDEDGEPCDDCTTECTDSLTRICACDMGACIDVETGDGCDLCGDCSEDDDDECDDPWGCC